MASHPHTQKLRRLRRIIGENIRMQRMERKMTLVKLSRLTKLNANRLDMFEMGKDEIELRHMLSIVAVLNCDIAVLFRVKP